MDWVEFIAWRLHKEGMLRDENNFFFTLARLVSFKDKRNLADVGFAISI